MLIRECVLESRVYAYVRTRNGERECQTQCYKVVAYYNHVGSSVFLVDLCSASNFKLLVQCDSSQ